MSADGVPVGKTGIELKSERNHALRIAISVTASFAVAEALDWDVTFLAPMLAAQFMIKLTQPPSLRQGLAVIAIIAVTSGGMAYLAAALIATPAALVLALGLVLFLSFYAHARGALDMLTLMIQISAVTVPVFTVISPAAGAAFAGLFGKAAVVAVIFVWIAFALFPPASVRAPDDAAPTRRVDAETAARLALRNTLVLMPILLWYLFDASQIAVVMLVTMVMLLRQIEDGTHGRMALAIIFANLLGGIVANVAYIFIDSTGQFAIFFIVLFAISLAFAGQIVLGGTRAKLLAIALGTFILLLGIGLSPLPGGSGSAFITRIGYILLAAVYTVGALSLFMGRPRSEQQSV